MQHKLSRYQIYQQNVKHYDERLEGSAKQRLCKNSWLTDKKGILAINKSILLMLERFSSEISGGKTKGVNQSSFGKSH